MSDIRQYREEYVEAEVFFQQMIRDRDAKAFEYGTLVVRNAVLVAGGGLLAIPALVGLADEVVINVEIATRAGLCFALGLLLAILAAYVVHINWTLLSVVWRKLWDDRKEYLRRVHLNGEGHESAVSCLRTYHDRGISITFWAPHFIAILYFISIGSGLFYLYSSFGL
jgi:hypothetical protein